MYVVFRVDSSKQIGTGHLMRCLTLADALSGEGADITFVCRSLPGDLGYLVKEKGFDLCLMPNEEEDNSNYEQRARIDWKTDVEKTKAILDQKQKDINWLIVDHYSLDYRWELQLRPYIQKLMVIDDLADRKHDCDLLLDQNYYENLTKRYDCLVPAHCQKLLGLKYLLLRQEFIELARVLKQRDGKIKRILVSFGGSDPTNETVKALEAIRLLNRPDIDVDVVIGASNQQQEEVKQLCQTIPNTTFYCQVNYMANLMAKADLALAAGGTSTWERCFMGLPTITLAIAPNQLEALAAVATTGAIKNLGWCNNINAEKINHEIKRFIDNPEALLKISHAARKIINISPNMQSGESIIECLKIL
jgi:UDP-2,4-diacetamido-2,4,6-trideoxy-beta-L-altropyranose hydrolase